MKFHDELNPKLWDKDNNLKQEVYDKLVEITEAFIEYLNVPEDSILDVRITGSSANYNYTPHSDLDLHVIVDYDKVHKDCPIVEGYLWSVKSQFNKEHDIYIYKIPVELYAEDSRVEAISNGCYSIMNDEWIKRPEKIPPTNNDAAVEAKYNELKEAVDRCDDSEEAQELQDKIYQMRKTGLTEAGELSTENLAFKKLRDAGCIDKLKQIKKQKIDKELTLETYNESDNSKECYIRILYNEQKIVYIRAFYTIQKGERFSKTLGKTFIESLKMICRIPKYNKDIVVENTYDYNEISRTKGDRNYGFLILNTQAEIQKTLKGEDNNIIQCVLCIPGFNITEYEKSEIEKYGIQESTQHPDSIEYLDITKELKKEKMNTFEITRAETDENHRPLGKKTLDDYLSGEYGDVELILEGKLNNEMTLLTLTDLLNRFGEVKVISLSGKEFLFGRNIEMKEDTNEPMFKVGDKVKIMVSMYKGKFRTGTIKDILAAHKYEVEIDPVEDSDDKKVSVYYTKDLQKLKTSKPESYRKLTRSINIKELNEDIEKVLNETEDELIEYTFKKEDFKSTKDFDMVEERLQKDLDNELNAKYRNNIRHDLRIIKDWDREFHKNDNN